MRKRKEITIEEFFKMLEETKQTHDKFVEYVKQFTKEKEMPYYWADLYLEWAGLDRPFYEDE